MPEEDKKAVAETTDGRTINLLLLFTYIAEFSPCLELMVYDGRTHSMMFL